MRKKALHILLTAVLLAALVLLGQGCQAASVPAAPSATEAAPSPTPVATPPVATAPVITVLSAETPRPSATPASTAAPSATPIPAPSPGYSSLAPVITKQPSGEGHYTGESAVFITYADRWTSLAWTAVSPSGREIDLDLFRSTFPNSTVIGDGDTTLTITNLNIDMSGWSFYCTFANEKASSRTNSARLKVTPSGGTNADGEKISGRVLRCPHCGEQVSSGILNCPYCGGGIYDRGKDSYVYMDSAGSIFYTDATGTMRYDSSTHSTTYEDHNGNYAIIDENGNATFGNRKKDQQEEESRQFLESLGISAAKG